MTYLLYLQLQKEQDGTYEVNHANYSWNRSKVGHDDLIKVLKAFLT